MTPFQKFITDLTTKGFEYFGRYYSQYPGFVKDNKDPLHMGRIKISVPEVTGEGTIGQWALPINNFAGKGYGLQVIPPIDSLVWVSFRYGSPKAPTFSLGYHRQDDKPEELRALDNFWFKTPKGNQVEFDDGKGTIIITQLDGTTINIEKDKISLNGKEIFLGDLNKASHPVAFGDKTKSTSNDMAEYLGKIDADLMVVCTLVGTLISGSTVTQIANITQRLSTLPDLIVTIQEIPSSKVKTE